MTETDTVLRPGAAAGGAKGRHPALWLVLVLLLLLFAPTLWWLWERWTLSVWNNGHGILIAGLVAWLVWGELKKCRELPTDSSALGFLILIPALAAHMLDTGIDTKLLSAAAMFAALPGLSLLFLGVERTKRILFPLLLLFLTLPIPLVFTEKLHLVLRQITTEGVSFLLPLLGVPVFASGTLLETPNGLLEVADSCSGFSTLYAAITVSLLVAYTTPDPRRKILVLLV
ncbi:MAG TPA: exosortase/archaeosortase family protein, partial [Sedimenticola sp.]|nr:exosortase/archaeosortase family protein [Sedimenticola sp.]